MNTFGRSSDKLVKIAAAVRICKEARQSLDSVPSHQRVNVELLEGVAKARYTLGVVAEFLHLKHTQKDELTKDRQV